jgi:outer membrane protein OmpA-like peptidoglycan-associated protein/uncharacterized protein YecT (DUF1311 family)
VEFRSVKILPGLRLNLSGSGTSVSLGRRGVVCCLAVAVCTALSAILSAHVDARDFRPCLTIQNVDQRVECLEGRVQPPQRETAPPVAAPNFATSFDCNKAASQIETLICSDSVLAQLDAQMGQAYLQALKSQGNSPTFVNDQRRWLASRDSKCGLSTSSLIRACLIQMTTARIAGLTAVAAIQHEPPDAPVASESIGTEKSTVKIVPDVSVAGPKEKLETDSQPVVDEAASSKIVIESIQSLLSASRTQNVRFFTYNVEKKELRGFKSDMPVLRVVYEERVFFDTDKAELRTEALPVVKSVASSLKQQKQKVALFVAGHTDARGSDEYNLNLSIRRAEAVARAIKKEGSGTAPIWRVGFGKAIPIRPNDSDQNMGLNRRVEFLIASQTEVITAWIKTKKGLCEDEACGTTSVVNNFQAEPISDPGAKPISIEIPGPKPIEIDMQFPRIEIGPPLR